MDNLLSFRDLGVGFVLVESLVLGGLILLRSGGAKEYGLWMLSP